MTRWTKVALGDVVDLFDHLRVPLSSTQRAARPGPFPYYGAQGIIDHIDGYRFEGRYLLVPEDGENLNSRKLPIAFFAQGRFWVNNHAHVLRAKPGIADDDFIKYALDNTNISGYVTGAAQPKLSQANLRRIELLLPPFPMQRRIANILRMHDQLIENNTRRIAILEEVARRTFDTSFAEPTGRLLSNSPTAKKGDKAQQTHYLPLAEALSSALGGDWGSEVPCADETIGVRVLRGTDFDDCRWGNEIKAPFRYISQSSLTKRKLAVGDIVVENSINAKTRTAGQPLLITTGLLARLGTDAIAASFCRVYRLKDPNFAPLLFFKMKRQFEKGAMAFYQNVAANGIANFQSSRYIDSEHLAIPESAALRDRVWPALKVFSQSFLADSSDVIRRSRDLLLPKLISGEINISDVLAPQEVAAE